MVADRIRRVFYALFGAFALLCCTLSLFLPPPKTTGIANGSYVCTWENGAITDESYAAAFSALVCARENGVVLERNGVRGLISADDDFMRVYTTLSEGSLAELLAMNTDGIADIGRTALYRTFQPFLWYSDDVFVYDGTSVSRSDRTNAQTVVLLSDEFQKGFLAESGAETLIVREGAAITASDLISSRVSQIVAQPPYLFEESGLYLSTAGGIRLVAALANAVSFTATDNVSFCDEGALSACTELEELTIPFVGSARNVYGAAYNGYFWYLFGENDTGGFLIPPSLKRIFVTGGVIKSHAFYGCSHVEEINTCGVPAENIEKDAFADCKGLRFLHTAAVLADMPAELAPCGCYLYRFD